MTLWSGAFSMTGWIKINRNMTNHWCASDPCFFAVWVRLLSEANFKVNKSLISGSPVLIKRGQLIFGLNAFSERSGVSVSKLRRVIKVLLDESMIDRQIYNKYSIISITNYDQYQSVDRQNTGKTQADDKQTTTLKEGKERKEETYTKEFEIFWLACPKKINKKATFARYTTALKNINHDVMLNGVIKYDIWCKIEKKEQRYIKSPDVWINKGCWDDELVTKKPLYAETGGDFEDGRISNF